MSDFEDGGLFDELEGELIWETPEVVEKDGNLLISLDADCQLLQLCLLDQLETTDAPEVSEEVLQVIMVRTLTLLQRHFEQQCQYLEVDTLVQTRGEGVYIIFSDEGFIAGYEQSDGDQPIRGVFSGLECLPVPVNYRPFGDTADERYEPAVCCIITETNLANIAGAPSSGDSIIAVPLIPVGVKLDRVVERRDG